MTASGLKKKKIKIIHVILSLVIAIQLQIAWQLSPDETSE